METHITELPVHDRLLGWFETNKKPILWGAVVVVTAGLAAGFVVWYRGQREANASQALSQIVNRMPGAQDEVKMDAALLRVATEHPNTDAGGRALLLAGAALFTEGKYSEAKAQFERFLREHREARFVSQALLGVAACLEAQGKINDAMTAYNDIVQHHSTDNVVAQARFGLARLYIAQDKVEQAADILQELARSASYPSISSEAAMRLEDLMAKHPNLVPARPASISPPATSVRAP